jgi:hypothetical protein
MAGVFAVVILTTFVWTSDGHVDIDGRKFPSVKACYDAKAQFDTEEAELNFGREPLFAERWRSKCDVVFGESNPKYRI